MTKSELSKSLCASKMPCQDNIIDHLCYKILHATQKSKNGKVTYGFENKLARESVKEEPWIN